MKSLCIVAAILILGKIVGWKTKIVRKEIFWK